MVLAGATTIKRERERKRESSYEVSNELVILDVDGGVVIDYGAGIGVGAAAAACAGASSGASSGAGQHE